MKDKTCEPILGDKVSFIDRTKHPYKPKKEVLGTLHARYSNVVDVMTPRGLETYSQSAITNHNCSKSHIKKAQQASIKKLKASGVSSTNQWY